MLKEIIPSMRPQQWYKNLILFLSIIFSLNILNVEMWSTVIFAFIIFCMLSGSEYIINDVIDIESDRKYPVKYKRPLASGKLKKTHALIFALGKRRHELNLLGNNAGNHRKNLAEYSNEMLDQMISINTGALIISYSLYTSFVKNIFMMLTIPVIIYGLFRYLFLVHSRNYGGEPEILFKDNGLLICMILWGILAVGVLYINTVIRVIGVV